jgi:hypothetical protein
MRDVRRREKRLVFCVLAALVLLCGVQTASAGAAPTTPSTDSFYAYKGSLAAVAPGTVLRTRQVQISAAGAPQAYPATQILYRTTDQLGRPSATVATMIQPAGAGVAPTKLLSYQTFYDGVASTCRPSYTLQGGDPSNTTANADEALMLDYVSQGFAVVTSDYEGPTDDYGAGHESGYGTLDAIRAAEHQLGLTAKAPVGLVGYSGGSIASEWASELQPRYAPELNLIGVAEGGIPADYIHTTAYIDGSSTWAGAIPAVTLGLIRAYKLNVSKYASAKGMEIFKQVEQGCLNASAYPGLKLADLLKPQYKDWHKVPIFARIFNNSIMSFAGTPKEPLLMGVGDADGTGDGVMIDKDVQELAYIYCSRHVSVQFHVYANSDHVEAAPQFEAQAVQFLQQVYNGQTPASECSSITPGNPFTPLPIPKPHRAAPRVELRHLAVSSHAQGVAVLIAASRGVIHGVTVELVHGRTVAAKAVLRSVGTGPRRLLLRVHGGTPPSGRYTLIVVVGRKIVVRRGITLSKAR